MVLNALHIDELATHLYVLRISNGGMPTSSTAFVAALV